MKELKTLKDLRKFARHDYVRKVKINNHGMIRIIEEKELKAEAVKWVKEKFNLKHTIGCGFYADKGWLEFMDFFNITEEDLKEGVGA